MQLPLVGGSGINQKTSRYELKLPVNAITRAGNTPDGQNYMSHARGIVSHQTLGGASHGAMYNYLTDMEYRASGSDIYGNGTKVTDYSGDKTSFSYSKLSTAFIDAGKLKFINSDDTVTEFKNWAEGERFTNYPDITYHVDFNGTNLVTIPIWGDDTNWQLQFSTYIDNWVGDADDRQFILISDDGTCGVWLNTVDKKFYYALDAIANKIEIGAAVDGENYVVASAIKFSKPIKKIGSSYKNKLTNILMTTSDNDNRLYKMTESVAHDAEAPTTTIIKNEYSTLSINNGVLTGAWKKDTEQADPIKSSATAYVIDDVIDVSHNGARYVILYKDYWLISSLNGLQENATLDSKLEEQRPDSVAGQYSAESSPDNNIAIKSWRDYVVVFGRHTIEYFMLTGQASNVYTRQQANAVRCGAISTHGVCQYGESFAMVGSAQGSELAVYVISPSQYQMISDMNVNDTLNSYKESELTGIILESIIMDNDEYLYLHLPNHTFVYSSSSQMWSILKTGLEHQPYTAQYIINNPASNLITIGDRNTGRVGYLSAEISSQYDEPVEVQLYTQLVKIGNGRDLVSLGALSLESVTGYDNYALNLFLSFSSDGVTYGNKTQVPYNERFNYTQQHLVRNLGAARGNVSFMIQLQIKSGLAISSFNLENV